MKFSKIAKITTVLAVALLLVVPASASVVDDLNNTIKDVVEKSTTSTGDVSTDTPSTEPVVTVEKYNLEELKSTFKTAIQNGTNVKTLNIDTSEWTDEQFNEIIGAVVNNTNWTSDQRREIQERILGVTDKLEKWMHADYSGYTEEEGAVYYEIYIENMRKYYQPTGDYKRANPQPF